VLLRRPGEATVTADYDASALEGVLREHFEAGAA
jgi:hypothetical protein